MEVQLPDKASVQSGPYLHQFGPDDVVLRVRRHAFAEFSSRSDRPSRRLVCLCSRAVRRSCHPPPRPAGGRGGSAAPPTPSDPPPPPPPTDVDFGNAPYEGLPSDGLP